MSGPLAATIQRSHVILCCGTGGVGKTTTAAALALAGAREQGRKAVVVTIDPARRLADALGVRQLDNEPTRVDLADGGPGELWAMMLDSKQTFDDLVRAEAADDEQAERILGNRYYKNLSTTLSGTQEFMATEKLFELHTSERFDLIVVDTPPSRNALDFVDAPDRLVRFLDGRLMRVASPSGVVRVLNSAVQMLLRQVARVVSAEVVEDTLAFLGAFHGMERGFRARASAVEALLAEPTTAFVLVTAPRREALHEGEFFVERLRGLGIDIEALIVNRMTPAFDVAAGADLLLRQLAGLARAERELVAPLEAEVAPAVVARVPHLAGEVYDLDGVGAVASHLAGGPQR